MLSLTLLDKSEPGGEQAAKAREIMGRQAAQLSRLVDELLDITRIKRNKIELQKEQVALNELVHRTAEEYQAEFQRKGIDLEVQPATEELYLEADPDRLVQVLGNLLHNAAKFSEPGGTTRFECNRKRTPAMCGNSRGRQRHRFEPGRAEESIYSFYASRYIPGS